MTMPAPEAWVAIGFVCFLALLAYLRLHRKVVDALDQRQARIKGELEDASRLREEAQALLAEFERKGHEAESEAAAIIESAKAEAERLAAEAKLRMEDFVARRTKMAEAKIAQAEAQALADVRAAAADAAVAAAEKILATAAKGQVAADLLARGIEDVRKKFN
jgi:F-type H+-transporting ATPase subunit b